MKWPLLERYPALDNQWFIACRSHQLRHKPIRRQILGLPIVLFRDENKSPVALLDRCPHRNAPLSKGHVQKGSIVCPYHGWQFDNKGYCSLIPALANQQGVERYQVNSFDLKEQDGFIWVYVSNTADAIDTLVSIPFMEQKASFTWDIQIQSEFVNSVENLLDATHTHFVHPKLIRDTKNRVPVQAFVRQLENGIEVEYGAEAQTGLIAKLFKLGKSRSYGRFLLPSIAQLEYVISCEKKFALTAYITPESDNAVKAYLLFSYPKAILPFWLTNTIIQPLLYLALRQDVRILTLVSWNIQHFQDGTFYYGPLDLVRGSIEELLRFHKLNYHSEKELCLYL